MDDDCSGIDEMGDGWTGVAGVWRWRDIAGVEGDGDDGFSWWGMAEDGTGADGVDGVCSVMAEDEAETGVDGFGGWGMSATEAVGVDWDDDGDDDDEDDDGSWSVTPLLLQWVVPAWYLMPTLAYSCHSWSSLA